jgi:hypothetical protein
MDPDDREFMRQLLLRHEKATDAMIARLKADTEESRRRAEESRRRAEEIRLRTVEAIREIRAHRRDFAAEMQAHRQTLFHLLDRLGGQGA